MASIKELRTRIVSVNSTKKITSAMKMVSASKLRKAQTAVTQMRPYADKLNELLSNLSSGMDKDSVYLRNVEPKKILIVAIASNSGLCGAFNSNVMKAAISLAENTYPELHSTGNVDFYAIGKKPLELLKGKGKICTYSDVELYDNLSYDEVSIRANSLISLFVKGIYDRIILVNNTFINAASQEVKDTVFLPLQSVVNDSEADLDYIYEPSKEYIVEEIIPRSLRIRLYSCLLESLASEHGARMTSMHKATDNAGDLLKALKLDYNKARQASITTEILEIVSGAEALG